MKYPKIHKNSISLILQYTLCAICALVVLFLVSRVSIRELGTVPFTYNKGDSATVLFRTHEMSSGSFLFGLNNMGYPGTANSYNSYAMDILLLIIQYILAILIPNQILSYNIFLLLSPALTALSTYYALNRFGQFRRPVSFALSIIYSMIPYYFLRSINMGHVYLGYFFVVPVAVILAYELYSGAFDIRRPANIIWLILIGTTGVYYAIFSCIFFLLAGIIYSLNQKKLRSLLQGLEAIGCVFVSFILAAIPTIFTWTKSGNNLVLSTRSPGSGEIFSVKLIQFFLPVTDHRISFLSELRNKYYSIFPTNESHSAALGIFMSLGLIFILVSLFIPEKYSFAKILRPFSLFTLTALLIACTGGLSTILGIIFPLIRCYNRMSIFIGFFGLIGTGYLLNKIYIRISSINNISKSLSYVLLGAIMLLSALDQCPGALKTNSDGLCTENYSEDRAFVSEIEAEYPDSGSIDLLTVPYAIYPENGPIGNMTDYTFMELPINSDRINISYGSNFDYLSNGMNEAVTYAEENGFEGIVVCRDAYSAEEWEILSEEITSILGSPEASSPQYTFWGIK